MSVNLDKYKDTLVSAWKEVMDEKHPTDWAIFGYEGQTFDLKLVSKGDDGLEGMVEDFNSGRIMYGLCRVKLKDRNVEKIALINWQGEGAPLARKGTCANHVGTIKNFFKGVHVTINARTDEEVEPSVILETVGKSTAADGLKMSSSLELDDPKVGPVGAIYKRVNPQEEINSKIKDDFWRQEQAEEERRKKDEQDKIRKFSQNEVKLLRRESQEYFNEQERASSTTSSTPISSPSPTLVTRTNGNGTRNGGSDTSVSPTPPAFSNAFMATEKAAVLKASAPRKNSASENLVRQRIKSFDGNPNESPSFQYQSNGSGTPNGNGIRSPATKNGDASPDSESLSVLRRKQLFESGRVSNSASNLIKKDPAEEIKSLQAEAQIAAPKAQASSLKFQESVPKPQEEPIPKAQEVAPKAQEPISKVAQQVTPKAQEPTSHQQETVTKSPAAVDKASKMQEAPARVESPIHRTPSPQKPSPSSLNRKSPSPVPIKSPSPQPVKAYNLPFHIGGGVSEKLAEKINKNSDNGLVSMGSNYSYEEPTILASSPTPPTTNNDHSHPKPPAAFEDRTIKSAEVSPSVVNEVVERISTPVIEGTASPALEIKPEMGLCARALYDYQAADDSEITFDPGEVITNIETIDEGWWEGMGPQGVYGLFPANYVELLN